MVVIGVKGDDGREWWWKENCEGYDIGMTK